MSRSRRLQRFALHCPVPTRRPFSKSSPIATGSMPCWACSSVGAFVNGDWLALSWWKFSDGLREDIADR
ncbi:hypothetical protein KYY02_07710 [Streptomyces pimonensis]|uniref:Uncharacterized protein n=1 Tax=Streptomyces pimonensis TaxID=2860288 RepID=A0ABV4IV93_9ACTN